MARLVDFFQNSGFWLVVFVMRAENADFRFDTRRTRERRETPKKAVVNIYLILKKILNIIITKIMNLAHSIR